MERSKLQITRITLGIAVVTYAFVQDDAIQSRIGSAGWGFLLLFGIFLLAPAIRQIKRIFITPDNPSPHQKKKLKRLRFFYGGTVIFGVLALSSGSELKTKGYIKERGYFISGTDALQQVKVYWLAAAVSLLIAVILRIKLNLSDQIVEVPESDTPDYVICPKCREPLWGKDNKQMICSVCSSQLEDLKGFYDRH